jgi:hypothetical protein
MHTSPQVECSGAYSFLSFEANAGTPIYICRVRILLSVTDGPEDCFGGEASASAAGKQKTRRGRVSWDGKKIGRREN